MPKDFIKGNSAREAIFVGVEKLANLVSVTMGPKGRNVIIGPARVNDGPPIGAPIITKDGVTVARSVVLEDPFEEAGCQLVKEAAGRTADVAGDGTTTSTVMTAEILQKGLSLMNSGYSALSLRDGLNLGLKLILENIDKLSRPIESSQDLLNVSTISANNDPDLGGVIAKAYELVDRDGLITAEAVPGVANSVRLIDGLELKSGYIHSAFLDKGHAISALKRCHVLILNDELSHIEDCKELFTEVAKRNASLLVIGKNINKLALKTMVHNHQAGVLKSCAIKIPTFRANPDSWLEDLAMLLGTYVIGEDSGIPLADVTFDDLGFAGQVEVGRHSTKIIEPKRDEARIEEQTKTYESDLKLLIGDNERFDIRKRKQFLTSKAAIITVGYSTELELKEKGDRADDAIFAVSAAIEEGIVPGGGMALFRAAEKVDLEQVSEEYRPAVETLVSACVRPFVQIVTNAGLEPAAILGNIPDEEFSGFNLVTEEYGNLFEMGVVDPKKVTRTALQNALSIGLLLLTTEAVIVDRVDNPTGWTPPPGWRLPSSTGLNHKY